MSTGGRGRGRGRGRSAASASPTKRGRKKVVKSEDESDVDGRGSQVEDGGRGRSTASASPAKRVRKTVVKSEDESDVDDKGSQVEDSDHETQVRSVDSTPKARKVEVVVPPRKRQSKSSPQWVVLEAEEDNGVSNAGSEDDDEDQLAHEGDEVGSEIDRVSEPDYVAFTRPSTSPIRKSKGVTMNTPPTPSPKKQTRTRSLKRPARPSMDSNDGDGDGDRGRHGNSATTAVRDDASQKEGDGVASDDEFVEIEATPSRRKSGRTRRPTKSAAYILDSDIEEFNPKQDTTKKTATATPRTRTAKSTERPAVTAIAHKISVPGLKKFPRPIEDAANNPLLDAKEEQSVLRSPKKKAKTVHIPSESEGENDNSADGNEDVLNSEEDEYASVPDKGKGKQPATPVSKLSAKLNKSVLDSAKKEKMSRNLKDVPADTSVPPVVTPALPVVAPVPPVVAPILAPYPQDMLFATNAWRQRASPSLLNTYGGLPIIQKLPICCLCWDGWGVGTLDRMVQATSVTQEPDRLRAIAMVISTSTVNPLIHNPARADWNHIVMNNLRREGQNKEYQYRVVYPLNTAHRGGDAPICFVFWGACITSNLVDGTTTQSSWRLKTVAIAPIVIEWERTFAFLSYVMDFSTMFVPNFNQSLNFSTRPAPASARDSGKISVYMT
ncbi:hypothetical protein BDW22DRAFT_1349537 [Trametopsis cervina]|nr:hypothetical protein BDW22DRAFT_1349537 [Trametopsis cervina]